VCEKAQTCAAVWLHYTARHDSKCRPGMDHFDFPRFFVNFCRTMATFFFFRLPLLPYLLAFYQFIVVKKLRGYGEKCVRLPCKTSYTTKTVACEISLKIASFMKV